MAQTKIPPQNVDAEQSVLGALLIDKDAVVKIAQFLLPEHFYKNAHTEIYEALLSLYEKRQPADLVTLTDELKSNNKYEQVGGASYLTTLVNSVPTSAHVEHYANIVKDKATKRRLITSSAKITEWAFDETKEVKNLLDDSEKELFSISQEHITRNFIPIKNALAESFDRLEEMHQKKGGLRGVPTGFKDLDNVLSGLQESNLIILAARPSMGKTTLAMNIVQFAATHEKLKVGIFSLEMSKEQLVDLMLASEANVDAWRLTTGNLTEDDFNKLSMAMGELAEAPIYIDDTPGISIMEMRTKARRLQLEHGLDLLVVDYLQLIHGSRDLDNRVQEVSEISQSLKNLARELKIPVMALSQLSRAAEIRGANKQPQLSDLRECITGETKVWLLDGRRIPIRELVGAMPNVISISSGGKLIAARSECVWRVGVRKVYSVRLATGRTIRATADHRLLGSTGWVKLKNINLGDRLAIARSFPEPDNVAEWTEARVILLAHLIGDGSYLVHQPLRYTTSSEENSKVVTESARKEFSVKVSRHAGRGSWHQLVFSGNGNRWHHAGINRWLRDLGIFGQRSHEKRVPQDVFLLSNNQIALFLRHLWATDGTIFTRRAGSRGPASVSFSTNSLWLAQDLAALLLRVDIMARIRTTHHKKYRPWYNVVIYDVEQQRRFLEIVGSFGPRRLQADKLSQVIKDILPNTNVDTIPKEVFRRVKEIMARQGVSQRAMALLRGTSYGGSSHFRFSPSRAVFAQYAEILNDETLRMQADSDIYWDIVKEIVPDGEEEVFDITVPGSNSWLADGIISHNSGAIEQDSDVVMFIYRENPEIKEDIKLVVAKHRSGPLGEVDLKFKGERRRFFAIEKHRVASAANVVSK